MKLFIIVFTTFFLLSPALSQFQLSHGTKGDESGLTIRKTSFDDGFIIGGYSDYKIMPGYNAILTKTKSNGNILWSNVYGGDGTEYFYSVRPITTEADKGYVALGATSSIGAGAFDMLFVRTDNTGTPVSVYTYGGKQYEAGNCIQVVKNPRTKKSELIMIGHSSSYYPEITYKMYVVKTSLSGKYLDAIVFADEGYHSGNWIEQTSDGGFIAVGSTSNSCCCGHTMGTENYDIFIVKLNYYLDVEWARTIGGESGLYDSDVAQSVKETSDGYIVTGYTESFSYGGKDAFILKLNHKGGLLWMKNYGTEEDDMGEDILNVEKSKLKYQYIINGTTTINGSEYALLLATDTIGDIVWSRGYGKKDDETGNELDRINEKGYVFTGSVKSFGEGERDIYHVLTDNYGNSYCPTCEIETKFESKYHEPCVKKEFKYEHVETGQESKIEYSKIGFETQPCPPNIIKSAKGEIDLASDKLIIYPNPATDFVDLIYPENYQHGTMKILNSSGQLIMNQKLLEADHIKLSIGELNNGIYLITIINNKGEYLTTNLAKTE